MRSSGRARLREWAAAATVFFLTFGLRFLLAATNCSIHQDGPVYIAAAQRLTSGSLAEAFPNGYQPGYPFLIFLAHRFLGDWEAAGLAVSLLLGSLAALPLYGLARRAFSAPVALATGLLYAIAPYPARLSSEVLTWGSFMFFIAVSAWAVGEGLAGGEEASGRSQASQAWVLILSVPMACFCPRSPWASSSFARLPPQASGVKS